MEEVKKTKIAFFTDLYAWKEGHALVILIYTTTKTFPKSETFGLTSQLQRCSVSVTSNIAEGFSRISYKEKAQFYSTALGSLTELQNQLIVAQAVGYITTQKLEQLLLQSNIVHKLLHGLIKATNTSRIHRSNI